MTTTEVNIATIEKLSKTQNDYMKRRFSTKDSQYNYDIQNLQFLNKFSFALLIFYFLIAAVYLGIIFIGPGSDKISNFFKFLVLLLFILYPFLITPFEYYSFRAVLFVLETAIGKIYDKDDYAFMIDTRQLRPG